MKFNDYRIDPKIKSQLEYMGFKKPTDIQYRCIPHILNGEDVMAVAPTGTGKTAAFVIPIINQLLKSKRKGAGIRALILVPTRELAKQIAEVIDLIGIKTGVSSLGLYGGVEQDSQITALEKRLDVLVATPGRMFDLISQGFIKLDRIECFVIDEADLMLDLGFNRDIQDVLKFLPKRRQTLFFTATVNKKIKALAYDVVRNAIRIHVSPKNPVSKNVQHAVSFVEMDDKRLYLENLLKEFQDGKFIVFVLTKVRVERVVAAMKRVGVATEALHGGLEQKNRFSILDRFRKGETNILITTDVACRGIDVPEMDYVINYDLPDNPENYVHRCGRTGRGNKKGHAISFCAENEKSLLMDIENYTGNEIERFEISPSDYKDIVSDSGTEEDWQSMISKNSNPDSWE